jgi:type I restriction enzyme S subunit
MKLAEVIDSYVSGDWGNEEYSNESPNAVFCVRGADIVPISNHSFNNIPKRYVSNRTIETKLLKEGDLVVEKSGGSPTQSTGRVVYISKDLIESVGSIVCSNFCTAIRVKPEWNPLYVYYYWLNTYNRGVFFNFEGKTSGIKNLQMDNALSAIEIEYLPLEKQNEIVAILSAIDSKIAINRQINDNLEAMAKQLYDYWFVQFDFPNEEGKPYKSSGGKMIWNDKLKRQIQEGWHCGTLLDIAIYTNGLACQKFRPTDENKLPVIKIKEMHDGISPDTEFVKSDIPEAVKVYDGDVLFSWSASLEVMLWAYGDGGLNQHIFKVNSKNNYPRSFYFYQLIDYIGNFKRMAEARKTTMGHITQDHLKQSTIALPPNADIANKLEERLLPVFDAIITNSQEIMNLTKQRDELLPLLMNGQVSVNYHLSHD